MLRYATKQASSLWARQSASFSGAGAEFLEMVEKYFDKAGRHTEIRPDILNFYKKADNVVKFNLTLIRGILHLIQMINLFKSSLLIDANTKLINFPPKEEQDMLKMLISQKSRLLPVS